MKEDECVIGAVRTCFLVVRVACVPAGRMLGFGRRVDGGIVIVNDDDDDDGGDAVVRITKMKMWRSNLKKEEDHILSNGLWKSLKQAGQCVSVLGF